MQQDTQPLFKGMTRPAMLFGVPMFPLIIVLGTIASIAVWTHPLYMLVAFPIVLIMRFVASYDDFMYSILFHGLKCKTPILNKKYYGVKTYTSLRFRRMSIKVKLPNLSILGLDRNPSFEDHIPFSSFKGKDEDGIVFTKENEFISTWKIKGISFEVEDDDKLNRLNSLLGNIFTAFSNESVVFYFHNARHNVDTKLESKFNNSYLQEINDLYYKSFTKGNSKATSLYLTMVYKPFLNNTEKAKFKNLSKNRYENELKNLMFKFRDYSNRLEANLSKFDASKLNIYKEDGKSYSSQLEFYNYLIGGRFLKTRALNSPINEYLIGGLKNIQFAQDLIQLNYNDGNKQFAQAIEIKDYTSETYVGILNSLMYLDVNYTITQSFTPMKRVVAKDKLKKQQNQLKASEDDSITQQEQFFLQHLMV